MGVALGCRAAPVLKTSPQKAVRAACDFHKVDRPAPAEENHYRQGFIRHLVEIPPMDLDLFIAEVTRLLHTDAESDLICTNAERVNLGRILNVVVAERNRGNSPIDVAAACEMVNAISWNELEALEKRVYPPKSPLEHAIFSGLFYVDHFADTVLNEQYDRTKKAT